MYYTLVAEDKPDTLALRRAARAAHIARLQTLQDEGRLLIAGPHPAVDGQEPGDAGFTGSLIVAEFACLEEAQAWANDDPYVAAGVYEKVLVKPFKKVFPLG